MRRDVTLTDVTLRDGLQDQREIVATEDKIKAAHLLADMGFTELEIGSFMHPDWVPQMADAEDVFAGFQRESVRRHGLVPNARGLRRALGAGVDTVTFVISASTRHNEENLNRTTQESISAVGPLIETAKREGLQIRGAVSTAFGCPFVGEVSDEAVFSVLDAYLDAGVDQVILADTIGAARRRPFAERLEKCIDCVDTPKRLALHLHDPGKGVGDLVDEALDHGIRAFDTAIAGLGGCPFAPGAPGNAKVESVAARLHRKGFTTGLNLERIPEAALTLGLALGRGVFAPERKTVHR